MAKTALLIGATGLVGEQCVNELLASDAYDKVISLTRKPQGIAHPKFQNIITDFENIEALGAKLKADDVYCAMGTTIGKAGSEAAFKKVDFDMPLQVAQQAKKHGAKKFLLVSSLGADASSSIFYSRVKGELEQALDKVGFDTLLIFRPSILLGDRKETRRGEEIGRWVAEKLPFLFAGPLKKYRGTPVGLLARRMVALAQQKISGTRILENEEILK